MSNIIPPLLSNTPPPIIGGPLDDDEDDEFGHFTSAIDLTYNCEVLSVPSSPLRSPVKTNLDVNSNTHANEVFGYVSDAPFDKDHQDKRKRRDASPPPAPSEIKVNSTVPVEATVDIPVNPEEINASVPDHHHHECGGTNVPSVVQSDRTGEDGGSEKKPPDLKCEPPRDDELAEEPPELDDFNYFSGSEDSHRENQCNSPEGKDNQVITLNSSDEREQEEESDFTDFQSIEESISRSDTTENGGAIVVSLALSVSSLCPVPEDVVESPSDFARFSNADGEQQEFADFSSFQADDNFCDFQEGAAHHSQSHSEDDDFGDYTQNFDVAPPIATDGKNVLQNAEEIIAEMFPASPQETCPPAPERVKFVRNPVFREIKDITETKALTYQWIKSSCQDNLLRALNIDTRNILYGPAGNPSMPKFAANLSFAPLEPVKSDILLPTPSGANRESPTPPQHHHHHPPQTDIPSAQFDWSGSGLTNPLDYTQANTMLLDLEQLVASLDLSAPSLTPCAPSPTDDFDEWEFWLKSLQKDGKEVPPSPKNPQAAANGSSQGDSDSVNSLQFATDAEEAKAKQGGNSEEEEEEDDFGDFASYQSPSKKRAESTEPGWLKPTILTPDLPRKRGPQTSAPEAKGVVPPVILEPLRPTVLQQPQQDLQINWPAPGLTDDDIRNIELNYSGRTKEDATPPEEAKRGAANVQKITVDDDDWSDFVCNPVSAFAPPVATTNRHFSGLHHSERSATPELQLSVPQLTHLQPPKAPIPVITPNGLIQTKIPSSVPGMNAPNFHPPLYTGAPSIISSQYQNHMVFNRVPKNGIAPSISSVDDDDWTEFISSPAPPRAQNGVAKNPEWNRTPNIIANPVHFDSYRNHAGTGGNRKQKQIPSISALPDLDFVAPKNRGAFTKK